MGKRKHGDLQRAFKIFDVDLRKALCDGTQFVERAHIAKSNIDQFFL